MNSVIDSIRFLTDLDRYGTLLKRLGSEPSIGYPSGESNANMPNIFFVDSGNGAAGNSGRSPDRAISTIDAAIGLCTANRGDVIVVLPGHSESISTAGGIAADVAGINIIGVGTGSLRPTVLFTGTAATIAVSAANVYINNIACKGGIDEVVSLIVVSAADCTLDNIGYIEDTAYNVRQFVLTTTAADDLVIKNCHHVHATVSAATSCIWVELIGADRAKILDCSFIITLPNHASSSTIAVTGTLATDVQVGRVVICQTGGTTQDNLMSFITNTTGMVHDVRAFGNVGTLAASMDLASCGVSEVYVATTVLKNGILEPVVA